MRRELYAYLQTLKGEKARRTAIQFCVQTGRTPTDTSVCRVCIPQSLVLYTEMLYFPDISYANPEYVNKIYLKILSLCNS